MNTWLLILTSLVCIGSLAVFVVLWSKNHREYLFAILVGAVAYFLFAIVGQNIFRWLFVDNNTNLIYFLYDHMYFEPIIVLGLIGLFEETARFVAFKTILKNRKNKITAINYGIGHAGIEALFLVGINYLFMALWLETSFEFPFAEYETVIPTMSNWDLLYALAERFIAMFFHIALSIFVFIAASKKKKVWIYPTCIIIHALCDYPSYLYNTNIIDLPTHDILFAIETIILFTISMIVYKKYKFKSNTIG